MSTPAFIDGRRVPVAGEACWLDFGPGHPARKFTVVRASRSGKSFWMTNGQRTLRVNISRLGWEWNGLRVTIEGDAGNTAGA